MINYFSEKFNPPRVHPLEAIINSLFQPSKASRRLQKPRNNFGLEDIDIPDDVGPAVDLDLPEIDLKIPDEELNVSGLNF